MRVTAAATIQMSRPPTNSSRQVTRVCSSTALKSKPWPKSSVSAVRRAAVMAGSMSTSTNGSARRLLTPMHRPSMGPAFPPWAPPMATAKLIPYPQAMMTKPTAMAGMDQRKLTRNGLNPTTRSWIHWLMSKPRAGSGDS
jgi:hypothetical protein